MIDIEVVYAAAAQADLTVVKIEPGMTLRDAIERSGVVSRHPEIDLDTAAFGVYGRPQPPETLLSGGERIEIYRPLRAEPKLARRQRVRAARRRSGKKV